MIDPELTAALKDYKARNISFYTAKQELLAKGYTDDQITFASAHIVPDAEPAPLLDRITAETLAAHPEDAEKTAKLLLLSDLQKQQRRVIGFDKGSVLGLFNNASRSEAIGLLRLPLGIIFIVGLVVGAIVWWLTIVTQVLPANSLDIFLLVFFVIVSGLVIYRMIVLNRSIAKLAEETGSPHAPHMMMNILFVLLALGAIYMVVAVLT